MTLKFLTASTLGLAVALATAAAQAHPAQAAPTGNGIWVAGGDLDGDGRPDARALEQNGTTVPSASDVAAPRTEGTALLLPAVQKAHSQPKRAKLKQNGTTVATAGEVATPAAE